MQVNIINTPEHLRLLKDAGYEPWSKNTSDYPFFKLDAEYRQFVGAGLDPTTTLEDLNQYHPVLTSDEFCAFIILDKEAGLAYIADHINKWRLSKNEAT